MMQIINIKKTIILLFFCLFYFLSIGQTELLKGTVVSSKGDFLENVKITVKENREVIEYTDNKGDFSISVEDNQHLVIQYKNDFTKVISALELKKNSTIVLDKDSKLVNTGFGLKQREEEIASSIGSLSSEKIENKSTFGVGDALFGQIAGLRVFQNTGTFPDERYPSMNIRGLATTQDNSILVLIDGVERPLSSVVPEEVESISVLRDAAAKAQYGQFGANGVLLVTTKRGSKGKTQFTASIERGITQPTRLPKFLDAANYAEAENEARTNDGLDPRYTQKEIDYFRSGEYPTLFPNVDWVDQTLKNFGQFTRFNFNFKGGSEIVNYYVGINYQNDQGLYKNTEVNEDFSTQLDYDQLNLRVNLDIRLTPLTLLQVNLGGYVKTKQQPSSPNATQTTNAGTVLGTVESTITRLAGENIVDDAFSIPSAAFPVKNFDGTWGGSNLFALNPVASISDVGFDRNNVFSVAPELILKQDLSVVLEGLSGELSASYYNQSDYWENTTKTFMYYQVTPGLNESGQILDTLLTKLGQDSNLTPIRYSGNQQRSYYDVHAKLAYSNVFGLHNINSYILFQQQEIDMHQLNQVYRSNNLVGNIHYGFANKYFLDATISYNGTNRIQEKNVRFGFFPAIAGAWLISKESFMTDFDKINSLKLRASYGKVGNGLITISDLGSSKYGGGSGYVLGDNYVGIGGMRETSFGIGSKNFESSFESNLGIEAQLFDRLEIVGEIFNMKRKDIFVPASGQYSEVLGLLPPNVPEGEVQNKGYELELTWNDQLGDFSYYVTGIFSQYKNKIINSNEEYRPYDYMKREGRPIGQYFGYQTDGFYSSEIDIMNSPKSLFGAVHPGDIKYVDQNDDNYIDEFDQVAIGNPLEIYYSGSLGIGYKGFQLSALFQGTGKTSAFLSQANVFWPLRGNGNISTWYENYWSPNNQNAALPRLSKQSDNNYRANNIWIRDNSFLKLRYAEISYSLPPKFLSDHGMQQFMIYLRGNNLLCKDQINYVDPENVGATYPSLRTYNVGIKVSF